LSASIPIPAEKAANRMVHSKITGMNAGQLLYGLPPTFIG
jgi:hypothetical protein